MTELPALSGKTKDELLAIAAAEQVDLAGATNNPDRIAAIEAVRATKAAPAATIEVGTGDRIDLSGLADTGDLGKRLEDALEKAGLDRTPTITLRVRTARKQPRRRAGFQFGPDAVDLARKEIGEGVEQARHLHAILTDPALVCLMVVDGNELSIPEDTVAGLAALIEAGGDLDQLLGLGEDETDA